MCTEVLQMIQKMDPKNAQTQLAIQCAPVITGIKPSNLLIVRSNQEQAVKQLLRHSGICWFRLIRSEEKLIYLLFHRSSLEAYLGNNQVRDILFQMGYEQRALGAVLRTFQARYQRYMDQGGEFPHEMGLLLGYPWEDVKGFIENQGKNSLYTGYWKVYENVPAKKQIFRRYEEAQRLLVELLAKDVEFTTILGLFQNKERSRLAV